MTKVAAHIGMRQCLPKLPGSRHNHKYISKVVLYETVFPGIWNYGYRPKKLILLTFTHLSCHIYLGAFNMNSMNAETNRNH